MKRVARWFSSLRRRAWFWSHRHAFRGKDGARRPRLLVDLSVIARHDARTGIQRVVRAMWSELNQRHGADHDFVPVYAGASHGYCYAAYLTENDRIRLTGEVVRGQAGDKFLGLDLSAHYFPYCAAQFDAWRAAGVTMHNVVYDILPLQRPEWFMPSTRRHFLHWFDAAQRHSDQLLCISDAVAEDVRSKLARADRPKIGRIRLSGNIAASAPSEGLSPSLIELFDVLAERRTILMVGTLEPRKGYDAALAAFDYLWTTQPDQAPDLLIVGKPGWCTDDLQRRLRHHPLAGKRLRWRTQVSDEGLTRLYDRCAAVLITSRGEGFGLPLSEAAYHQKWVLCRDLPVFREQGLPNCLFFSDETPIALGRDILDLAAHADRGSPPRADLVDWKDCLDELLDTLAISRLPRQSAIDVNRSSDGAIPAQ